MEIEFSNGRKLRLLEGDITKIRVDSIVNAANSALSGGGGVDGAIHRAGGPEIMRDLQAIRAITGVCPPGSAVVTGAGALPAHHVIHAVGPIYQDGKHGEAAVLASCYETALALAEQRGARTVSVPAISTGAYGYPLREAAEIALRTIASYLAQPGAGVREVLFVLYDAAAYAIHVQVAQQLRTEFETTL